MSFVSVLTLILQAPISISISILDAAVDEAVDAAEVMVTDMPDMPAMVEVPIFILGILLIQSSGSISFVSQKFDKERGTTKIWKGGWLFAASSL